MQTSPVKALVIGAAMVDIVCSVDRLPQSGEGVVPRAVTKTVGGCALNSAAMLKHLGVEPNLFAPVGEGLFATMVKETIVHLGLNPFEPYVVAASAEERFDCGAAICLVEPDGERTMITMPGVERHFAGSWFSALSEDDLRELQAVTICGYELETPGGEDIIGFLEAHPTIQVFYAPGPRVNHVPKHYVERLKSLHAIWHLNDLEACSYTGQAQLEVAGEELARHAHAPVVITAGSRGSFAFLPQNGMTQAASSESDSVETIFAPSTPVVPINTVGAGDAHLGAVVAKWIQGSTWHEVLSCANKAAAEICLIEGTTL